jgi:hypothetical protein
MKELETFVKTFGEGLRTLAQGVHAIADKLDGYVDSKGGDGFKTEPEPVVDNDIQFDPVQETPDETVSREKRTTNATAEVYEKVSNASKSITLDELHQETGYDKKKLSNILHRLKKQDKIKNIDKGAYTVKGGS